MVRQPTYPTGAWPEEMTSDLAASRPDLVKTLHWAATHYVAPLSVLLERAAPPNLPTSGDPVVVSTGAEPDESHPLHEIALKVAKGQKRPTTALIGRWQSLEWLDSVSPILGSGASVLIVTGTAAVPPLAAAPGAAAARTAHHEASCTAM